MKNVARGFLKYTRPSVHTTLNESTRLDENNVDMDQNRLNWQEQLMNTSMISSVSSDISRLRSQKLLNHTNYMC